MFVNHPEEMSISCSCWKFESWGFLCSHALKVLDSNDVEHLPSHYSLKRWTREARCDIIYDVEGKEVDEEPNLTFTQRYRELCSLLVKLASEASPTSNLSSKIQASNKNIFKKNHKWNPENGYDGNAISYLHTKFKT